MPCGDRLVLGYTWNNASRYHQCIKLNLSAINASDIWIVLLANDSIWFIIEQKINSIIFVPSVRVVF